MNIHPHTSISNDINIIYEYIKNVKSDEIVLLRERTVIQWIFNDLSFLTHEENKQVKANVIKSYEDEWGRATLKLRRPDLKLNKQWTNKFGEHICEELFILKNEPAKPPTKKKGMKPDLETEKIIIEVKTGTYYTTGTAGEKILGCPFKYAEIPDLYKKPLHIICIGGAEKSCRESYGNLNGPALTSKKKKFLDFYENNDIIFLAITDILRDIARNNLIITPLTLST